MSIVLVGMNHRTAPVELRERLTLTDASLRMALQEMSAIMQPGHHTGNGEGSPVLHESVILSTCNRMEVYARAPGEAFEGWTAIEEFLASSQGIRLEDLKPHLYYMEGKEAVGHLMRVAAGLDSMILGEPQILGQVSDAFAVAQTVGTSGPVLSHLFAQAIHAGKRARTETDISRHTTSVSHAAAQLAKEKLGDLSRVQALIVGVGEMAELGLQALVMNGAKAVTCINRTHASAEDMARKCGGRAVNWYELQEALSEADLVLTATGAPHTVIQADDVQQVLTARNGRDLFIIDIGVPRDVEESVGDLPNVHCYDIDDLQGAVDAHLAEREAAVPQVEAIVAEEAAEFVEWVGSRHVVPLLIELRRKAKEIADDELQRALGRMSCSDARCREIVETLVHRVLNKVLHDPTVRLKGYAANGNGYGYLEAIRDLFALECDDMTIACPCAEDTCTDEI